LCLFADGTMIGDSNAAVDWVEAHHPAPALLPADPVLRAQVRAFEVAATETLAPCARLAWIGRVKAMQLQPIADHFAATPSTFGLTVRSRASYTHHSP
jgi:glutathione S-transferase